ncbi:hypothetical protein, partial [Pantoea sp. GbtcB22]|uniref:hypothetical protein n=1 Tax=Pantoea sp. GbtcB22 TaxID=2824767 RepID=UPI001C30C976
ITDSSGNGTLTGNQAYTAGSNGAVTTTLGQVAFTSGSQYLNQDRLDPGPQTFAITTPDPATGTNSTFQVYNSASLDALAPVTSATSVP